MGNPVRARVIFTGRVQGVFFRDNTRRRANELGVRGWVRNLPDGTVEAVFDGEKASVEEVIRWCTCDQPHALVEGARMTWEKHGDEFDVFEIR